MIDDTIPGSAEVPDADPCSQLRRIADVLGCSVTAFYCGDDLPSDPAARQELLALWGSLRTDASRWAVLSYFRAVAAAE